MTFDEVRPFLEKNHRGVVVTFRRNGAAQASIVACGHHQGGVAFTTTSGRAKLTNLKRDPHCTILVSKADWTGYVVLEGNADIRWRDRTAPEELRLTLRDVYRSAGGGEHPDWDDYDRAMVEEDRAAIIVRPHHIIAVGI